VGTQKGNHYFMQQFNLYHWLFDDARTAGYNAGLSNAEDFRFFWAWIIFSCVGLLIAFYYGVEGRKRFFKTKPLAKYMLDKYLTWLAVLCFVALIFVFGRVQLDASFFSWRFWRVLWAAGFIWWASAWLLYLVRVYPKERANLIAWDKRQQYVPKSSKRKAKAGAR
jgi:hypothetical protein